jgi:hydroxyethylthiazole kinase-like uncharacterized protein yjeF
VRAIGAAADSSSDELFWTRLSDALLTVSEEQRTPPPGARTGAVLVMLEDGPDGPRLVLTRRRPDLRSHPGQVAFPGGRIEPGETPVEAAVREAVEEVALDPGSIEVLGTGPVFYIPPSRFWVVPVVARWVAPHALHPDPGEVAEVLHVDLGTLRDERRWRATPISAGRGAAWAWQLDDDLLWGATAFVVRILLDATYPGWSRGRRPDALGPGRERSPWEEAPRAPRRARLAPGLPERAQRSVPHADPAAVRAVRAWLDAHGIDASARAEQAGRALAEVARRFLTPTTGVGPSVTVLAGPSSNGAGGLVAARLLAAAGLDVEVVTVGAPRLPAQTHALRDLGVQVLPLESHPLDDVTRPGALVIDAVLGIGARPPMQGRPGVVARWLRRHDVPVVALDIPSGLSPVRGLAGPCVTADVTVALGLPVQALLAPGAQAFIGDLHLADLGVPAGLWRDLGLPGVPDDLFAAGPLLRLTLEDAAGDAGTPLQAEPH